MEYNLKIAEQIVLNEPGVIKTILGSCIGLCLWDKRRKIGGMVHIMLATNKSETTENKSKYADTAVHTLIEEMKKQGANLEDVEASIYGGASMFASINKDFTLNIGLENFRVVKEQLKLYGIRIKFEDVGGTSGRYITFDTQIGEIIVRVIDKSK